MKKNLLALLLAGVFIAPAIADKPEWTGKGKPSDEQKAAHQAAMQAKEDIDDSEDRIKEKKEKKEKDEKEEKSRELKGIEKQSLKKSEQPQKELDKGSDKGKESREVNNKKWWKFWGE